MEGEREWGGGVAASQCAVEREPQTAHYSEKNRQRQHLVRISIPGSHSRTESDAPAVDLGTAGATGEAHVLRELPGLDGLSPGGLSSAEADAELRVGEEKEYG